MTNSINKPSVNSILSPSIIPVLFKFVVHEFDLTGSALTTVPTFISFAYIRACANICGLYTIASSNGDRCSAHSQWCR